MDTSAQATRERQEIVPCRAGRLPGLPPGGIRQAYRRRKPGGEHPGGTRGLHRPPWPSRARHTSSLCLPAQSATALTKKQQHGWPRRARQLKKKMAGTDRVDTPRSGYGQRKRTSQVAVACTTTCPCQRASPPRTKKSKQEKKRETGTTRAQAAPPPLFPPPPPPSAMRNRQRHPPTYRRPTPPPAAHTRAAAQRSSHGRPALAAASTQSPPGRRPARHAARAGASSACATAGRSAAV